MTSAPTMGAIQPEAAGPSAPDAGATTPTGTTHRWQRWALVLICLLAAVLYGWGMWSGDWGNAFYSAAVKSMSESFTNFLFGSFDPAGVVTVDKPPMALWPQVFSVLIFGWHSWAVLLPQVIEGAATVFLFHRTVRRWAGENVALLAALILALTPITVAIDHVNNPDTLLVLWLVASAYALTRAVETGAGPRTRTKWLLWCAFFVGCGFVTKMLAAWIVVPGFAIAFLAGTTGPWRRRVLDLAGATVVLLVSSFWWPLLHDLWPGSKPYMGGSTDGSAMNLIFGYNGFGRIFGENVGAGGGGGARPQVPAAVEDLIRRAGGGHGGGLGGFMGGGTGLTRMFGSQVGGQISWLLPLSLLVLVVVAVAGVRHWRAKGEPRTALRAGWTMWGTWLVVMALVFSFAQGIWHPYYTTALAPAIAALSAAGLAVLWRAYRNSGGFLVRLLLPAGVALTAVWAYVLVEREPDWNGWAGPAVLVAGGLAVVALVIRLLPGTPVSLARAGLALAVVAVLLVPAVWSAATAFAGTRSGGAMAQAGPSTFGGFGGGAGARGRFPGQVPGQRGGFGGFPGGGRAGRGGGAGGFGATLSRQDQQILAYVTRNAPNAQIKLAVESGANAVAPFIIDSDVTVIDMGGFMGTDNVPTTDQLAAWVDSGKLKYVLGAAPDSGGRSGFGMGGFGMGGFGMGGGAAQARDQWVSQHCTVVNPSAYGGSTAQQDSGGFGGFGGGDLTTLYECTAH